MTNIQRTIKVKKTSTITLTKEQVNEAILNYCKLHLPEEKIYDKMLEFVARESSGREEVFDYYHVVITKIEEY